jgi:hypothetical protein
MKHRYFIICIFTFFVIVRDANAQSTYIPALNTPNISIDTTEYNLGIIPYNGSGMHTYLVINKGAEPLIITHCVKSCGCTSVDWTKTPIKQGETGIVKVVYNTKKPGIFIRNVEVYSNDPLHPKIALIIKGIVQNDPTASNMQVTKTSLQNKMDGW